MPTLILLTFALEPYSTRSRRVADHGEFTIFDCRGMISLKRRCAYCGSNGLR